MALVIFAHIHNTRTAGPKDKDTSPFDDVASADPDFLSLMEYKQKFHGVSILLPHPYQDAVSEVWFDFRLNRHALDRVFAFRSCQFMKHLDLWDESTLPLEDDFAIEAEENSDAASHEGLDAILEQSLAFSKPKNKE